jgi:hypothetical protein
MAILHMCLQTFCISAFSETPTAVGHKAGMSVVQFVTRILQALAFVLRVNFIIHLPFSSQGSGVQFTRQPWEYGPYLLNVMGHMPGLLKRPCATALEISGAASGLAESRK